MTAYLSSTRGRLVLIQMALLGAAILVADVALYVLVSISDASAADDVLRAQAINIDNSISTAGSAVRFDPTLPSETEQGIAIAAAIVEPDGTIVQTANQPLSATQLAAAAASVRGGAVWMTVQDAHGVPRRLVAQTVPLDGDAPAPGQVVVVASRSIQELQTTLARTALFLGTLSCGLVVVGGVLAHRLAGRALKPVREISTLARSLSEHSLSERVRVAAPADELRELVDTFNGMLGRLESAFASLRRFTADASHELRTPLTLMRTQIEGALARPRDAAGYRATLLDVQREVAAMSRLADELLVLARADAGVLVPARSAVDVADALILTAERWKGVAEAGGVTIAVDAPESGTVPGDPDLLQRVLDNLVGNAVQHSRRGQSVSLSGYANDTGWVISVADHGDGVPTEARDSIFQRFARADPVGSGARDGAGLGLAVSLAIVQAHHGSIELRDADGGGAIFEVTLPGDPP